MAQYLPETLLPEALEATRQIRDKYYAAKALQGLLPYLEKLFIPFDDWEKMLDDLAYQNHMHLLSALPNSRPIEINFVIALPF